MQRGTLFILIIPSLLAFCFCIYVMHEITKDIAGRESSIRLTGPDTVRMKILPNGND